MKLHRFFALCLALCLMLGILSGCGNQQTESSSADAAAVTDSSLASSMQATGVDAEEDVQAEPVAEESGSSAVVAEDESSSEPSTEEALPVAEFPLVESGTVEVSIWYPLLPFAAMMGDASTPDKWLFFETISDMSGLQFDFHTCDSQVASDQFSLMVAGGDYTDIFSGNYYAAGIDRAIEDEVYLGLNDLIDEYCPNYAAQLAREDVSHDAYTDNGNIGVFYLLANEAGIVNAGLGINGNFIDQLGLDTSVETYDDYEEILEALYNAGVETPLYRSPFDAGVAGGYNNIEDWIVVDGTVQYGLVNDQSLDYYTLISDWYKKGYLWQDYYSSAEVDEMTEVFARAADMTIGVMGGNADAIVTHPESNLTPLHAMVQNEGESIHVMSIDSVLDSQKGWVISAQCDEDKQILIAQLADYLYTDEAMILNTWGIEGVSFEYDENGDAQFTDAVMSEFDIGMLAYFKYANMTEAGLYDMRRMNFGLNDEQIAACEFWSDCADNTYLYPNTSLNDEELEVYNQYFTDAETYIDENINSFITGQKDLSEWDSFVDDLYTSFHFDEVIAAKQSAYDRYMER